MPEANKIKKDEVMVDIDTSGPETEVNLPEEPVQETAPAEQETVKVETVEEKQKQKQRAMKN
jgi:hypothetical protein